MQTMIAVAGAPSLGALTVMGGGTVGGALGTAAETGAEAGTWIEATSPGITGEMTDFLSGLATPQYTPGLAGAVGLCASMPSCSSSTDSEIYLAYP